MLLLATLRYFVGDLKNTSQDEAPLMLGEKIKPVIRETRKVCGYFKNSPLGNEHLQTLIKLHGQGEFQMKIDCKTRWSSLNEMIKRFLRFVPEVEMATKNLKREWNFQEEDIVLLSQLSRALEVMAVAVNELSAKNVTLCSAEIIYKYTMDKLERQNTPIATELCEAFKKRINERRYATLTHLMEYLRAPSYLTTNKNSKDAFGHKIVKKEVIDLGMNLVGRLFSSEGVNSDDISMDSNNSSEMDSANNDEADSDELRNLIAQQTVVQMQEHSFKNLKEEFAFWDKNPNRSTQPDTLKKLLAALEGIPISSIEPEHVFSVAGSLVTKTRARLGDDSVDSLVFFKKYYNVNKAEKLMVFHI